jgi:hypothetical protein
MAKYQIIKATTLPSTLQPNTVYYVKGASDTETQAFVTNSATSGTQAFPLTGTALRTSGDTGIGALRYAGTTRTSGQFYGGTTNPSGTIRLNYDGNLHARSFFTIADGYVGNGAGSGTAHIRFRSNQGMTLNVSGGETYNFFRNGGSFVTFSGSGIDLSVGGIATEAPSGYQNPNWKLGNAVTGAPSSFSHTIYIQVGNDIFELTANKVNI